MDIKTLRKEYRHETLSRVDLNEDPFIQFKVWVTQALDEEITEANAMTLATASKNGRPSSRTVLLKEIDGTGFLFYTNYNSKKGRDIAENPHASITIYWKELEKQVCIEGRIEKSSAESTNRYFQSRPRLSQLGAWCSKQGEIVESRQVLEAAYREHEKKFAGKEIPVPLHWGGYRLIPETFTFWQGREGRLHDRFLYVKEGGAWAIHRLAP